VLVLSRRNNRQSSRVLSFSGSNGTVFMNASLNNSDKNRQSLNLTSVSSYRLCEVREFNYLLYSGRCHFQLQFIMTRVLLTEQQVLDTLRFLPYSAFFVQYRLALVLLLAFQVVMSFLRMCPCVC